MPLPQSDLAIWTAGIDYHRGLEVRYAVASATCSMFGMAAASATAWVLAGPLILCAVVLGLFASHHNNRRRAVERSLEEARRCAA